MVSVKPRLLYKTNELTIRIPADNIGEYARIKKAKAIINITIF
ncbi:hypothetical protein PPNK14_05230 [Pectobacterium parmentieri]